MNKSIRQSFSNCLPRLLVAAFLVAALPSALPAQNELDWQVVKQPNALDDANVVPSSNALSKALHDAAEHVLRWQLPVDAEAWQQRRKVVRQGFLDALGLTNLPEHTPLATQTI
ncbi:MAG TPA: hypothetical protein VJ417_00215, partial [Candidatus Glassbacteria bacterium]|nr:hypothetical protein [Candidatus Glassbacteria bacterium]